MYLEKVTKRKNRKMKGKRLGRGQGSGVGAHTVGRGQKGQKSRTGHKSLVMFEGGNVPFYRKMPKFRGFKANNKWDHEAVNVSFLSDEFKSGDTVSVQILKERGLIRKRTAKVKVLGHGEIDKKLTIEGLALSESAREKILGAKGSIK